MCNYLHCNLPLRRLYLHLNIQHWRKLKKNVAFAARHDKCVTLLGLPRLWKKSGKLNVLGILRLFNFHVASSLHRRRILTSASNVCEEVLMSLFWAPRTQQITGRAFRISFHLVRQIDIGMARSQILVHRWGPEQGFRRCFAEGLDQQLVSSAVQAMFQEVYVKITKSIFLVEKKIVIVWFSYFDASNAVKKKSIFLGTVVIKKIENEMVEGRGREREREREKNLPFFSPLLYLFLSRPRISFRTAVSLTLRTTKEKTHQKNWYLCRL